MKLGQYRFTNETFINVHNDQNDLEQVMVHENVHRVLSGNTTFGILLMMLEKVSLVDDSRKWLIDEMVDVSNKMHEQVATFVEYLNIYVNKEEAEFEKEVNILKENKKYFKYFNFVYQLLDKEFLTKESAKELINIVEKIAYSSLNVIVSDFHFEKMKDRKDFKRIYSKSDNNLKLNPNKRFEILIKSLIRDKKVNDDSKKIFESIFDGSLDELRLLCKDCILKLYSESPFIEIIRNRLESFKITKYIEINNESFAKLNAFPSFEENSIEWKFDFGDFDEVSDKLISDQNSYLHFAHIPNGLESVTLLSYMPSQKYADLVCYYEIESIFNIIDKVPNTIIFSQGKLYKKMISRMRKEYMNRSIYIFLESSFINNYYFVLKDYAPSNYIAIEDEYYDIIAIHNRGHILLQVVIKNQLKEVKEYLKIIGIVSANSIEFGLFNIDEIRKVSHSMFQRINWQINNKQFGFK